MAECKFDPYYKWLGIRPEQQPPSHYRLLGIAEFEDDPDVIRDAAERQMGHVRTYQLGPHAGLSQQMLNELASAKGCLLDPQRKAAYDQRMKAGSPVAAPPTLPPASSLAQGGTAGIPPAGRPQGNASLDVARSGRGETMSAAKELTCRHCGTRIRFTQEDRGLEVYCNGCGRANSVPEVQPPLAAGTPSAPIGSGEDPASTPVSVFSSEGELLAAQSPAGQETCLCGAQIVVRVEDCGGSVYCPSCGTEIRVGASLRRQKYCSTVPVRSEPAADNASNSTKRRSGRRAIGLGLFLAAATAVGWFLRPEVSKLRPVLPFLGGQPNAVGKAAVPGVDSQRSDAKPSPYQPEADRPISLEMIDALEKCVDPLEALVQAQVWDEVLCDDGVKDDEPRRVRLVAVIRRLRDRLTPRSPLEPARLREFHSALRTLADALAAHDLAAARQALAEAEALLRKHPHDLGEGSRRLVLLKELLRREEAAAGAARQIGAVLAESTKALADGDLCRALEREAEARLSALRTPLTEEEIAELDRRSRTLRTELRLAQGKRAVDDARIADRAADRATRCRETQRAQTLLPGLPEEQIRPLLEAIRPWQATDTPEPGRENDSPSTPTAETLHAKQLRNRDLHEQFLSQYGAGETVAAVQTLLDLERLLSAHPEQWNALLKRMTPMLLNLLEHEIVRRQQAGPQSADAAQASRELGLLCEGLGLARAACPPAQWEAIDSSLRWMGGPIAVRVLAEARRLANEGRVDDATDLARRASLIAPKPLATEAQQLCEKYRLEASLRQDRRAEEECWAKLAADVQLAVPPPGLWQDLTRYMERFPQGGHREQVDQWAATLRARLERDARQNSASLQNALADRRWAEARQAFGTLEGGPLPADLQPEMDAARRRFAVLREDARRQLLLLAAQRDLASTESLRLVVARLPEILALDPENQEAQELWQKAQFEGALRADKLLRAALPYRTLNPTRYRERLEAAAAVDPQGRAGARARELLRGI